QVKSGSIGVLLMILLFGSGNFLKMEREFVAGRTNVTAQCSMPKPCNVYGFTDWYKVGSVCVKYFNRPLNFTDAEFSCRTKAPGALLVSVDKKEHNDYLLCIVKKFNPNNLRFWLGAFELFKSGQFLWVDGSYWDFQIWTRGEPNHMYTSIEECATTYVPSNEICLRNYLPWVGCGRHDSSADESNVLRCMCGSQSLHWCGYFLYFRITDSSLHI
uniref:C-type lectin domain-containing protein n=1 Tax=Cyprinus carpio TaxID=7962 RepID=A0A8C2PUT6_CYPCA